MRGLPVARDVDAARDPDPVVPLDVVQETLQRGDAARAPKLPAMHADAHHLGAVQAGRVAFGVQRVGAVLEVLEERIGV